MECKTLNISKIANSAKCLCCRFLLATYHMDIVTNKTNAGDVIDALDRLPPNLDARYDQILTTIEDSNVEKLLAIIAAAKDSLSIAELKHAMAVTLGHNKPDIDELRKPNIRDLASLSAGLIDVNRAGNVRLAHETIRIYVSKRPYEQYGNADGLLGAVCLSYLSVAAQQRHSTAEELEAVRMKFPFIDYAARFHGHHVVQSSGDGLTQVILAFYAQPSYVHLTAQALCDRSYSTNWDAYDGVHGLHFAAYYGMTDVVISLLDSEPNVDVKDCMDTTPLMYAVSAGHANVVRILVKAGADPGLSCRRGLTSLHRALNSGRVDLVGEVLSSAKDPGVAAPIAKLGSWSFTALHLAASRGYVDIVRELLKRNVDPAIRDRMGATAFIRAVDNARFDVVRVFLQETNVHLLSDDGGRNALHSATVCNRPKMLRFLLESHKSFDPNVQGKRKETPLHDAVSADNLQLTKILLEFGARIDIKNRAGKTPLSLAIEEDKTRCLPVLKDAAARQQDPTASAGQTLDTSAAHQQKISVYAAVSDLDTSQLRAYLDELGPSLTFIIDNTNGYREQTALVRAAQADNLDAVRLLLDRGADPSVFDIWGWTALTLAIMYRCDDAFLELIGRVDIDDRATLGKSPLEVATEYGRSGMACALMSKGADLGRLETSMSLLLRWAAEEGTVIATRRLVQAGADPTEKDEAGLDALARARKSGNGDVADYLQNDMKTDRDAYLEAKRRQEALLSDQSLGNIGRSKKEDSATSVSNQPQTKSRQAREEPEVNDSPDQPSKQSRSEKGGPTGDFVPGIVRRATNTVQLAGLKNRDRALLGLIAILLVAVLATNLLR